MKITYTRRNSINSFKTLLFSEYLVFNFNGFQYELMCTYKSFSQQNSIYNRLTNLF